MTDDKWGVGNCADAKAFTTALIGRNGEHEEMAEIITGQHPHSRSYNSHYARMPNGTIQEFDGHYRCIDVAIRSYNYLKESGLSGDQIRKGVNIAIFSDREQVYEAFHREPDRALLKAHSLIQELQEHSSGWLNKREREGLVGRRIFYREIPAVISRLIVDQGSVILSTADGKPFPPPAYRNIDWLDDGAEPSIKDDVLSPHIWWFREGA